MERLRQKNFSWRVNAPRVSQRTETMSSVTIEKTQDVNTNLELTNTYGKERDFKHAVYETFHIDSGSDFLTHES